MSDVAPTGEGHTAITIRSLHKNYGSVHALKGIDLDIPKGSIYGLLGPNGAGKSTTFGILCGWLQQTSGQCSVLGLSPRKAYRARGRISALPQDAHFPPQLSIESHLRHFSRLMGETSQKAAQEAARVLEMVGLSQSAKQSGAQLSHGMGKRLGLAQALLGEPELLFLDEPTAGLDPQNAAKVKEVIADLAPRATVVLSSHNLVDVQSLCTHGAILDHGTVVAQGTMAELTHQDGQVGFEFADGMTAAQKVLAERFGDTRLRESGGRLWLSFDAKRQVSEVLAEALPLLLEAQVPLLSVQRGTSLEKTFLEATKSP